MTTKNKIGWFFSVFVPIIVMTLPTNAAFTGEIQKFFAITAFVIVIFAFELLPQIIAAFLLPSLYYILGLTPITVAFSSWSGSTVWIVLGGLVFSTVLDQCGILKRIAYYIIIKCGGTFKGAVWGCFFIGVVLNLITFCNGWLISGALVYGLCEAMNLKVSKESAVLCFAGIVGGSGPTVFLYYPGYYSIIEESLRHFVPDFRMHIYHSFLYNGAGLLVFIVLVWAIIRIYGIKDGAVGVNKEVFAEKYRELGPVTPTEKKALVMIALLVGYLFSTTYTGLPAVYGFMIVPALMFFPGVGVGSREMIPHINFSIVFFVSSCLGIGIVGQHIGIGEFLCEIAIPVLQDQSPFVICAVFMLIGTIANFFMTPYAMLGGLSIPFAQIAVSIGMDPLGIIMVLLWSCEILFLPYESAGYLIMYGYGHISIKEFLKLSSLKSLFMFIAFACLMYPLWNLLDLI